MNNEQKKNNTKRHYYHLGDKTIVCYENCVPEGYTLGPSEMWKRQRQETYTKNYGVTSPSQLPEVKQKLREKSSNTKQKREKTLLERYGVDNPMKDKSIQRKLSHIMKSEEVQSKTKSTCITRYGVTSTTKLDSVKNKMKETLLKNYGVTTPLKSSEIMSKKNSTMLSRYGVITPLDNEDIKKKRDATLRKNKTYNTSEPEKLMYEELITKYGKEDVYREYTDSRYPFKCDFYVKSVDLFIELNLHPSHGEHPFDPSSSADVELLEELKHNNNSWSDMIVDVWSHRDYNKIKFMKDNNLNYLLIYPEDYYRKED